MCELSSGVVESLWGGGRAVEFCRSRDVCRNGKKLG